MKTNINVFTVSLACLFFFTSQAQDKFSVEVLNNMRSDFGLSYNFFLGDDNDDFSTTINGFGSGFLLDAFSGRFSRDFISIGTDDVNITFGAGVAISKYRFSEDLIFNNDEGVFNYSFDNNPSHDYGSGFLSYGKSKLVVGSVIFPVNLNVSIGEFLISAGGTIDQYLSGKHKRKFKDNGEKTKVVIQNDDFNDFPINKTKAGIGAMIMHKNTGLNIGFTYMLTPFFKDQRGPDLNELRISVSYDLSLFDYHH
jgi:hypothetical protein